jgi:molecular chaperone DnaK
MENPKIKVSPKVAKRKRITLKKSLENYFGGEKISDCVVSVPACFNDTQRQTTIDACKMAGLNVQSLISEPVPGF